MQILRGSGPAAAARAAPVRRTSASPENKRLQSDNRVIPNRTRCGDRPRGGWLIAYRGEKFRPRFFPGTRNGKWLLAATCGVKWREPAPLCQATPVPDGRRKDL